MEKIGIGIATFNRNRILDRTINHIKRFTNVDFKLVIVDDGSKIPIRNADFRFNVNQGSPIAKNKCLELLEGCEHIFLFDDDTFPIKEGWHDLYVKSGVKHLNYCFRFAFKEVDNLKYFEKPNGCMMYIHRDALDTVGGFDTEFIKYGHWHGAYSNRVFNVGLITHPFIDVIGSNEFIYSMDERDRRHRSVTNNQRMYLINNKKLYDQKIDSKEFIDYKSKEEIKIYYSNPYNTSKNIGKALNDFCALVPDDAWICLQDGDILYLTPDWGVQIEDAIRTYGDTFGLIGCVTNRLGRPIQRIGEIDDDHDILKHYKIANELKEKHWGVVEDVTSKKYIAGMFMLFPKKVWNEVKFRENCNFFDDVFSQDVTQKGYRLGMMKGLYVYHLYRAWSDRPRTAKEHLI